MIVRLVPLMVAIGCTGDGKGDTDPTTPAVDGDADTDTDADSDADTDTDTEVDGDSDGFPVSDDCDDTNPEIYPGAPDVCGDDAVTDCDRTSDYGLVTITGGATVTDLQEALDGVSAGGEILVCPGRYVGAFVAPAPVDLVSFGGAAITDLDAEGAGTTLSVPADSTVTGFTILGGVAPESGGGLLQTTPGALQVTDCVVRENRGAFGGGIAVGEGATVTITGSTIERNDAVGGGGLAVGAGSTVELVGSVVARNEAEYGGGVLLSGGALIGGQILDNTSTGAASGNGIPTGGGGVAAGPPSARLAPSSAITGSEIAGNSAVYGGGFSCTGCAMVLTDVLVHDNDAPGALGGGGWISGGTVELAGISLLTANTALDGGGLYVVEGAVTGGIVSGNTAATGGGVVLNGSELTGTAVEDNLATQYGGGLSVFFGATLRDVTVARNTGMASGGGLNIQGPTLEVVTLIDTRVEDNGSLLGGGMNVTTATVVVEGSSVLRNTAGEGGGARVDRYGSSLTSTSSDWGTGVDDNTPEDVLVGTSVAGYGADASFVCTTSCDPLP